MHVALFSFDYWNIHDGAGKNNVAKNNGAVEAKSALLAVTVRSGSQPWSLRCALHCVAYRNENRSPCGADPYL